MLNCNFALSEVRHQILCEFLLFQIMLYNLWEVSTISFMWLMLDMKNVSISSAVKYLTLNECWQSGCL